MSTIWRTRCWLRLAIAGCACCILACVLGLNNLLGSATEQGRFPEPKLSDSSSALVATAQAEQVQESSSKDFTTQDLSATVSRGEISEGKTRDSTDEVGHTLEPKLCETIRVHHIETELYKPGNCLSRKDIQTIILELVWTIADVFEKHQIQFWLDSGTLLGSFCEKTMIPHDKDADIGFSEDTCFRLRDEKLNIPSGYELHVFEAKYHKRGNRDAAIPSRLIHTKSGMYVDIFVFLDSKTLDNQPMFGPIPSVSFGNYRHCPRRPLGKESKIPKSWVYPLQPCEFGGRNVTCPARPTYYLRYLFGPNYMTPDRKRPR
ncbi:hypothetical protein FI667_g6844, partial [Globisporangium splendens]